jgi:hypothetical protein
LESGPLAEIEPKLKPEERIEALATSFDQKTAEISNQIKKLKELVIFVIVILVLLAILGHRII